LFGPVFRIQRQYKDALQWLWVTLYWALSPVKKALPSGLTLQSPYHSGTRSTGPSGSVHGEACVAAGAENCGHDRDGSRGVKVGRLHAPASILLLSALPAWSHRVGIANRSCDRGGNAWARRVMASSVIWQTNTDRRTMRWLAQRKKEILQNHLCQINL
jgi:hypothetical protein